ncbi:MAG: AtpZ/AtpI family protein [Alphaproteobacteria bacterium]|nr:MAG: AtpZ/AtpI family protein [Alphaproteobacteria bacterium]TAF76528.1 MAG: AtpZ/AtpI family protein [Alphaproteobacteria bacterium]
MTPEEIKRIVEEKRAIHSPKSAKSKGKSGMSEAWDYLADMIAGVLVGLLMGYWIDIWFGTKPIMLVLCMILGSASGIMMMMRKVNKHSTTDTLNPDLDQENGT